MPKLIAVMPVRDEEWILEKTLADLSNYVDEIVIVDDGSIDRTPQIIRSFSKVTAIHTNPPGTLPFNNGREYLNRNKTLELARQRKAEWILQIDADEMLESCAGRHIPKLVKRGCSVLFPIWHLWGDTEHFRIDGEWGEFHRWSMFRLHGRYAERLRYSENVTIARPRAYDRQHITKTDLKIVHFGWLNPKIRIKHMKRYFEAYKVSHPQIKIEFDEFLDNKEIQEELKIIKQDDKEVLTKSWKEIMGDESQEKYKL